MKHQPLSYKTYAAPPVSNVLGSMISSKPLKDDHSSTTSYAPRTTPLAAPRKKQPVNNSQELPFATPKLSVVRSAPRVTLVSTNKNIQDNSSDEEEQIAFYDAQEETQEYNKTAPAMPFRGPLTVQKRKPYKPAIKNPNPVFVKPKMNSVRQPSRVNTKTPQRPPLRVTTQQSQSPTRKESSSDDEREKVRFFDAQEEKEDAKSVSSVVDNNGSADAVAVEENTNVVPAVVPVVVSEPANTNPPPPEDPPSDQEEEPTQQELPPPATIPPPLSDDEDDMDPLNASQVRKTGGVIAGFLSVATNAVGNLFVEPPYKEGDIDAVLVRLKEYNSSVGYKLADIILPEMMQGLINLKIKSKNHPLFDQYYHRWSLWFVEDFNKQYGAVFKFTKNDIDELYANLHRAPKNKQASSRFDVDERFYSYYDYFLNFWGYKVGEKLLDLTEFQRMHYFTFFDTKLKIDETPAFGVGYVLKDGVSIVHKDGSTLRFDSYSFESQKLIENINHIIYVVQNEKEQINLPVYNGYRDFTEKRFRDVITYLTDNGNLLYQNNS